MHADEELVRQALARVAHIENAAEKARRVGVSEATMSRWLAGKVSVPLRGSRAALERFLATGSAEVPSEPEKPSPPDLGLQDALVAAIGRIEDANVAAYVLGLVREEAFRRGAWPETLERIMRHWRAVEDGPSAPPAIRGTEFLIGLLAQALTRARKGLVSGELLGAAIADVAQRLEGHPDINDDAMAAWRDFVEHAQEAGAYVPGKSVPQVRDRQITDPGGSQDNDNPGGSSEKTQTRGRKIR